MDDDPFEELDNGRAPSLKALRLHNSTVYRWNRVCYGISDGKPHLRIENRILPSGPTPRDEMANAAFWFGLISGVLERYGDIAEHMDFDDARIELPRRRATRSRCSSALGRRSAGAGGPADPGRAAAAGP